MPDGKKDVLGFWARSGEGAKFWLSIFSELRQRGLQDILILCADGLAGIKEGKLACVSAAAATWASPLACVAERRGGCDKPARGGITPK